MPGLIRGVARTAVVAGTATAVSNRVSRRQGGRWAAQEQRQYEAQMAHQQPYAQQPYGQQGYAQQPYPEPHAAPPEPMPDKLAQLQQLGDLRAQGVLSEVEFQQQKARILNS